ncbi:MAG: LamG domain-containing protein [Rhodocyclaceae bacterium]|nr:LamG domain-containing protein [Rhodocyclaceae bacterium]
MATEQKLASWMRLLLFPWLLLFCVSESWAAISFVASFGRRNTSSNAQVRATSSEAVAEGNLLIAQIVVNGTNDCGSIGTANGWIRITCHAHTTANQIQAVYWRAAKPSDLNVTYSFPLGASRSWGSILLSYAGVDLANPLDAGPSVSTYTNSKSATASSITTQTTGAMIVKLTSANTSANGFFTPPSSYTERRERACVNNLCRITASDFLQSTAGATGAVKTTLKNNASGIVHLLGLRPYSLVAYWPLDGVNWLADASGNNHTLTANGGAEPVAAKVCTGFQGTGTQYLTAADSSRLDLPDRYTLAAWIFPTAYPTSDLKAILSKDENYELHLNPTGKLYWWWTETGGTTRVITSSATIPLNQWTHVAVVFDRQAANQRQRIYINGVQEATTYTYSAAAMTNTKALHIGSDVNYTSGSSNRNFLGRIDEVYIFSGALTASEIAALMSRTHPCAVDHYRLKIADGSALTCEAEAVVLEACSNPECSMLYQGTGTVTLSASGGATIDGGSSLKVVTLTSGAATAMIRKTAAGVTTLDLSGGNPTPTGATPYRCFIGNSEVSWAGCQINFQAAKLALEVPDFTACTGTGAATITVESCASTIKGSKSLKVWMSYLDPPSANGEALKIGNLIVPTNKPATTNLTVSFDDEGQALLPLVNYDDAGELTLYAEMTDGGATFAGQTSFVSAPQRLVLTSPDGGICSTSYTNCPKFKKAGESFPLKLSAQCSSGKVTKNFRLAAIPLFHTLLAPSGGQAGSFAPDEVTLGAADNGEKTFNASLGEVGAFKIEVSSVNYKGNDVSGSSISLGRFYPAYFDTEVTPGCGSFTYSGQPFRLKVTAKNLSGEITKNYFGGFAKNGTLSDAYGTAGKFTREGADCAPTSPCVKAEEFIAGVANLTDNPKVAFVFTNKLTAPANLKVRAKEINTGTDTDAAVGESEGTTPLRSGRLVLYNAHGSEQLGLTMPIETQYWTGSAWATNTLDSCTNISSSLIFVKNPSTLPSSSSGGGITAGKGQLNFSAPNQRGYVEVCANLGVDPNHPLSGCRNGTAIPWLQGSWDSDGQYDDNPSARATFGVFQQRLPIIYRRERY